MEAYLSRFLSLEDMLGIGNNSGNNSISKEDIVDMVFEVEFGKSNVTREERKWLNDFPAGKTSSLQSTANYLMKELGHQDLSKYNPGKERFPPCSIMRSAQGKPSNCVGRVSSLVLLSEMKGFEANMSERLMIEIEVNYKQNLDGTKSINGGHITAYTDLWGDKTYLGSRDDSMIPDPNPVEMLPAVYALQTALARIQEKKYSEAKKLASLSRKWNVEDSEYISKVATKIVDR